MKIRAWLERSAIHRYDAIFPDNSSPVRNWKTSKNSNDASICTISRIKIENISSNSILDIAPLSTLFPPRDKKFNSIGKIKN